MWIKKVSHLIVVHLQLNPFGQLSREFAERFFHYAMPKGTGSIRSWAQVLTSDLIHWIEYEHATMTYNYIR